MENSHTISEMNEVIALFEGRKKAVVNQKGKSYVFWSLPGALPLRDDELHYHESWDELMPVVEKIEALRDSFVNKVWVNIDGNKCAMWTYFDITEILRSNPESGKFKVRKLAKDKITATFQAVYEFIQWYNKQKNDGE